MKFKMVHNNINVLDLEKSMKFYKEALGLNEVGRIETKDNSFSIVYLANEESNHQLELTYLKDKKSPYNLGDNEFHLAFRTDDFEGAYELHKSMEAICYENREMGIYFINDPDGYWIEVLPTRFQND